MACMLACQPRFCASELCRLAVSLHNQLMYVSANRPSASPAQPPCSKPFGVLLRRRSGRGAYCLPHHVANKAFLLVPLASCQKSSHFPLWCTALARELFSYCVTHTNMDSDDMFGWGVSKKAKHHNKAGETAERTSSSRTPAFLEDRQAKQDAALVYSSQYLERERARADDDRWRKRIESRPAAVRPGGWSHTGDRGSDARSRSPSQERPSFRREGRYYPNAKYHPYYESRTDYDTRIPETSRGGPPPPPPQQTAQTPIVINNIYARDESLSEDSNASDEDRRNDNGRSRRAGRRRRGHRNEERRNRGRDKSSSGAHGASGAQQVLSTNGVNAIWDPSQNTDLTIHLKMPLQENQEEKMDEFCRLHRRGDYASARQFFAQELLPEHEDDPYLLVQYAEMLLKQGDYATLASLHGHVAFSPGGRLEESKDGVLLRMYWNMMQVERSINNTPTPWESFSMIPDALQALHDSVSFHGPNLVGSTQVSKYTSNLFVGQY